MRHTTRHTQRRQLSGIISYALAIALLSNGFLPAFFSFNHAVSAARRAMPADEVKQSTMLPATAAPTGAAAGATTTSPAAALGRVPLYFEQNVGQTSEAVKFIVRGAGYTTFLTADEAVFVLSESTAADEPKAADGRDSSSSSSGKARGTLSGETSEPVARKQHIVRMHLAGANKRAEVAGVEELAGKVNYFVGSDESKWHAGVPTFARVEYKDVYPGIDMVYYGASLSRRPSLSPSSFSKPATLFTASSRRVLAASQTILST